MKKVSVIICGHGETIAVFRRAIDSVLSQDYDNKEIIVIDDSYNGRLAQAVPIDKVNYVRVDFRNNAKALNEGLKLATGDYIAILDGDDEWIKKDKLSLQVAYIQEHSLAALGTFIEIKYPDGTSTRPITETRNIEYNLLIESPVCHSSVLYPNIGLRYDEKLRRGKDLDMLLKLGRFGEIAILPEVCVRYYQNQSVKRWYDSWNKLYIILKHRSYPYWKKAFLKDMFRLCVFFVLEKILKYKRP